MKGKFVYGMATLLSLALICTVAIAKRFNEVEHTYLNANGQVVGGKTFYCNGGQSQWGIVTASVVTDSTPCD